MKIDHNNDDQIAEVAAAYALDSLDGGDVRQLEAHVPDCKQCSKAVAEMQDVAGALGMTVDLVDPPVGLRQQVLDNVRRIPMSEQRSVPRDVSSTASRGSFWSTLFARGLPAMAVAELVFIVGLGVFAIRQHTESARMEVVQSLLTSPRSRVMTLNRGYTHLRLIAKPDSREAYVVVNGLPALPQNRDYQVWLMNGKHLESAGVFHPNGEGQLLLRAKEPIGQYKWIGVTREPSGGSPQPTTKPIVSSNITLDPST